MMKNDYRRSLIMLRALERGYSGHVRLEHRTLTGSMVFVVTAPSGGTLCAALVRWNSRGEYAAARLGELRRDSRGQATLAYSFDPRCIDGHPLSDYSLIAVTDRVGRRCDMVLAGNLNGSRETDWNQARIAACSACARADEPAFDLPVRPDVRPARPNYDDQATTLPDDVLVEPGDTPTTLPDDIPVETDEQIPVETPSDESTDGSAAPLFPASDDSAGAIPAASYSDADANALNPTLVWPGESEGLRSYFAGENYSVDAPDDGYLYVEAPMPEESGYDSVRIGVRPENGVPESVAYALPGRFSAEPPEGLEDYEWSGDGERGWWVAYLDAASGHRL